MAELAGIESNDLTTLELLRKLSARIRCWTDRVQPRGVQTPRRRLNFDDVPADDFDEFLELGGDDDEFLELGGDDDDASVATLILPEMEALNVERKIYPDDDDVDLERKNYEEHTISPKTLEFLSTVKIRKVAKALGLETKGRKKKELCQEIARLL